MAQPPEAPQVNIDQASVIEQLARMITAHSIELAHTRAALDAALAERDELKRQARVAKATEALSTPGKVTASSDTDHRA